MSNLSKDTMKTPTKDPIKSPSKPVPKDINIELDLKNLVNDFNKQPTNTPPSNILLDPLSFINSLISIPTITKYVSDIEKSLTNSNSDRIQDIVKDNSKDNILDTFIVNSIHSVTDVIFKPILEDKELNSIFIDGNKKYSKYSKEDRTKVYITNVVKRTATLLSKFIEKNTAKDKEDDTGTALVELIVNGLKDNSIICYIINIIIDMANVTLDLSKVTSGVDLYTWMIQNISIVVSDFILDLTSINDYTVSNIINSMYYKPKYTSNNEDMYLTQPNNNSSSDEEPDTKIPYTKKVTKIPDSKKVIKPDIKSKSTPNKRPREDNKDNNNNSNIYKKQRN